MYSEGDAVLCTVEKIEGVTVFVSIDKGGNGSIVTSEVAPGRIRNIRNYVVPHKKIVCKILKIDPNKHVHLSLRRVSAKERKEVMDSHKREKVIEKIFKVVLEKKAKEIISKIREKGTLDEFVQSIGENLENIDNFLSKKEAERIVELVNAKRSRDVFVKKSITLTCADRPDGVVVLKKVLGKEVTNLEIKYLGGSKFSFVMKGENYKDINTEMNKILEGVEDRAKKEKCIVELSKK